MEDIVMLLFLGIVGIIYFVSIIGFYVIAAGINQSLDFY